MSNTVTQPPDGTYPCQIVDTAAIDWEGKLRNALILRVVDGEFRGWFIASLLFTKKQAARYRREKADRPDPAPGPDTPCGPAQDCGNGSDPIILVDVPGRNGPNFFVEDSRVGGWGD